MKIKGSLVGFLSLVVAGLMDANTAIAGPTVRCDPPKGVRLETDGPKSVSTSPNGMSGVNPVFIFDDIHPKRITALIDSVGPAGTTMEEASTVAIVVAETPDQITAVEADPRGTWVYSFFPKVGLVYYSVHSAHRGLSALVGRDVITNDAYYSFCRFVN